MKIEYDKSVDALAITFVENPRSARTKEVAEGINLDFDSKGNLIQIEILDATRFDSARKLGQLPSARVALSLAEAAAESGFSADTLRSLIHKKRLPATKDGRASPISLHTSSLETAGAAGRSASSRERARARIIDGKKPRIQEETKEYPSSA